MSISVLCENNAAILFLTVKIFQVMHFSSIRIPLITVKLRCTVEVNFISDNFIVDFHRKVFYLRTNRQSSSSSLKIFLKIEEDIDIFNNFNNSKYTLPFQAVIDTIFIFFLEKLLQIRKILSLFL